MMRDMKIISTLMQMFQGKNNIFLRVFFPNREETVSLVGYREQHITNFLYNTIFFKRKDFWQLKSVLFIPSSAHG
jgi:hypothetical protein